MGMKKEKNVNLEVSVQADGDFTVLQVIGVDAESGDSWSVQTEFLNEDFEDPEDRNVLIWDSESDLSQVFVPKIWGEIAAIFDDLLQNEEE